MNFFTDKNVEEFQYLLQKEKWDEVSASNEPNTSFNIFMDTFRYYFNIVFHIEVTYVKESIVNKWITKGIIVSRHKLRLLDNIKRSTNLPMGSLKYIQNYQLIHRKSNNRGKKERDRLILSAKYKNKALWKIINKEIGNSHHASNNIINIVAKIITNPQTTTETFNSCFTEVIEDLLSQVNYHCPHQYLQFQIKKLF
jgi:hypothetical protein